MHLKIFDALLPYFGGKRKLCPVIFYHISRFLPREKWFSATFVDAFLGSGAVSLYAKARGFKVICNDISERSYIAGKALIENNRHKIEHSDLERLYLPNSNNQHFIEREFVPDVFLKRHAEFLDNAFVNADGFLNKYLLMKYIFAVRPYSKFSSPNAFNRPMEEGRFDEIKPTYRKHIQDNLKSSYALLMTLKDRVNSGIFTNNEKNEVHKRDVYDFVKDVSGDILYLDPPYPNTLAYEEEYQVLDKILGEENPKSRFSMKNGMEAIDFLLEMCGKFPLWVISCGNAGGRNELKELTDIVRSHRKCEVKEFNYRHCEAMATEKHKQQCREWLVMGWK